MSVFQEVVLRPAQDARDGKVMKVPISLERVSDHIAIRKRVLTLIGSNPGSGKTSFVDDQYVLGPYDLWQKNRDKTDLQFRALYVNGERPLREKLAKWACWKLYKEHRIQLDVSTFLGYTKMRASVGAWDKFVACRDWVDELLDYVDIKSQVMTPETYYQWGILHAKNHGTLIEADTIGIKYHGETTYIDFFQPTQIKTLKNGEVKQFVEFKDKFGKFHTIFQLDVLYIENDTNLVTQVVYDHLGKNKGEGNKKDRIDRISQYSSEFRDVLQFSPVLISQFNRALGNTDRMKLHGSDLSPSIDDFKDSSNTQEDADIILALFNPFRYKAFDEKGKYMGYAVRDLMLSPLGFNRFRSLSILKNSYGIDDAQIGLKFLGEVMTFQTMPEEHETAALTAMYKRIAQNL